MLYVDIKNNPIATNRISYGAIHRVFNWSHKITATNGFDRAGFDLILNRDQMEQFFDDGLGRMITRYSEDGNIIVWQGYINSMTLTQPGTRSGLSLDNMFNQVSLKYTSLDTALNPPGETVETYTAQADDLDSQGKYGIKQTVYSPPALKLKDTMADQMRDTFIDQYREPRRNASAITSMMEPRLHIECKGYKHTLAWRIYNQVGVSAAQNANLQIADILATSGLFIDSSALDANTTQVQKYYNDD